MLLLFLSTEPKKINKRAEAHALQAKRPHCDTRFLAWNNLPLSTKLVLFPKYYWGCSPKTNQHQEYTQPWSSQHTHTCQQTCCIRELEAWTGAITLSPGDSQQGQEHLYVALSPSGRLSSQGHEILGMQVFPCMQGVYSTLGVRSPS